MSTQPSFWRASGWIDPSMATCQVCIIGCGAVGSNVALLAAKMGFSKFVLFDDDTVEDFNLPNQAYWPQHVGMKKVDALADVLTSFNAQVEITKFNRRFVYEDKEILRGIVIMAVDSMAGRTLLLDSITLNSEVDLVMEARLGFTHGEVNRMNPADFADLEAFRSSLRDDSEVPEGPCNLRICATLVSTISGILVHEMSSFIANNSKGIEDTYKRKVIVSFNNSNLTTYSC